MTRAWAPALVLLLSACSPVYVYQSAAGHGKLLWHRRSVAKDLADPKTPPELKKKLEILSAARDFAFDHVRLKRTRDYSTYTPLDRPYVTYVVSGARRARLESYYWRFPFIGAFPYKGYFAKENARREMGRLEAKGWDAALSGVTAYHTPLFISDPMPSPALELPPGELAELVIHELAHGTVFFKNQVDFDESLAGFIGERGALEFLERRFGAQSPELAAFHKAKERDAAFTKALDEIYAKLDALYRGPAPEADKLKEREGIFAWGRLRLKEEGFEVGPLNNAVVLAHRVYHTDSDLFEQAYERNGRDWVRTVAFFKLLDRREPGADLRRRLSGL